MFIWKTKKSYGLIRIASLKPFTVLFLIEKKKTKYILAEKGLMQKFGFMVFTTYMTQSAFYVNLYDDGPM